MDNEKSWKLCAEQEEEEEEEEAIFIRGVNTNEDSPYAQHAPHRPVQEKQHLDKRDMADACVL